jgi:hypothetical protein
MVGVTIPESKSARSARLIDRVYQPGSNKLRSGSRSTRAAAGYHSASSAWESGHPARPGSDSAAMSSGMSGMLRPAQRLQLPP